MYLYLGMTMEQAEHTPIPITVPYSGFLSSAETACGQIRIRARE